MNNKYLKVKNTGIGALNIPWSGKYIKFDEEGYYPSNTIEYLKAKNTGIGALNIPWSGKYTKFDEEGNKIS